MLIISWPFKLELFDFLNPLSINTSHNSASIGSFESISESSNPYPSISSKSSSKCLRDISRLLFLLIFLKIRHIKQTILHVWHLLEEVS